MTDNLTKEQRSKCMSHIKSKWTSQEIKLHNYLKALKIKHKMHPKLTGNPDVFILNTNIIIFLHGCFWHKCPKCYKEPKSKKEYWIPKIENNVIRDCKNEKILKALGFKVLKVWEHELKNVERVIKKISNKGC